MAELDDLIRDCPADVLIVSDACYAYPESWEEFIDYTLLSSSDVGKKLLLGPERPKVEKRTRIFIGSKGMVFENDSIHGGLLWFLVMQGLAGSADLLTPGLAAEAVRAEHRGGASLPDGFVTLGELVTFVNRHRGELATIKKEEVTVWGQIVGEDPILVRHTLPID